MKLRLLFILFGALSLRLFAQDGVERRRAELAEIQQVRAALDAKEKMLKEQIRQIKAGLDTTKSVSNFCPVHHTRMRKRRVPINYGMQLVRPNDPPLAVRKHDYPFALDYLSGGCAIRDPSEAIIYICPDCQRAEKKWKDEHKTK